MFKSKVLVGLVIVCYFLFAYLEFNGFEDKALFFNNLIVPIITTIYILTVKKRNIYFLLFLVSFSLSDILSIVLGITMNGSSQFVNDLEYYIGNSLYVIAYFFLVVKLFKSLDFNYVKLNLKTHTLVLLILNSYLLFVLHDLMLPNLIDENDYYIEFSYNIVIFVMLTFALLNYFYRDNKKSLFLFFGALCIVFAEVMDIAYIYIAQRHAINLLSSTLALVAFYFFYKQSKLTNTTSDEDQFVVLD